MTEMEELPPVETAHTAFRINTRDTHKCNGNRKARKTKKKLKPHNLLARVTSGIFPKRWIVYKWIS